MKTLRWMFLTTALFVAVLATAEPARQKKGSPPPPPAAPTTRGPNQPTANGPSAHGPTHYGPAQPAPQWGQPAPTGNRPDQPGGAPNGSRPDAWTPSGGHGWGQPGPQSPPDRDRGRDQHGPGQPPRNDWNQPSPGGRPGGPGHDYAPPRPAPQPRRDDRDDRNRGRDNSVWRYAPLVALLFRAFEPSSPKLGGAAIVGYGDMFLGTISRDADDPDSVANPWGRYGSPYSADSIWNTQGRWGSRYATDSPWDPYATRPPRVFAGDEFRGYLTANTALRPRIDPEWLHRHLDLPAR